jgi:hypothetical protein
MYKRKVSFKVMITTPDKKQQEFTVSGVVQNPDIELAKIAFWMEYTLNEHLPYLRVHADITEG